MLRAEKTEKVKELRERFEQMSSAVLVDYQGMTVAEASNLRDVFRAKGIIYKVVKNTLVRHALADQPWAKNLEPALHGMTGIAWSFDEPSAAARLIKEFRKENKKLNVKVGVLEGQVLNADAVENTLAALPNKDEARAMLLATFNAPAQRMAMLLNALVSKQRRQ